MIQVNNVSKNYGGRQALININFNIKRGEVVGLLGLNGAGKSTTMNILTGYISADSGSVTIGGYDIAKEPLAAKKLIGYLPEQFFFYSDMKVIEYLNFICDIKKIKKDRKEHLDNLCDRVGIAHIKNRMIKNLSKGYRQRVGFVQALLGDPQIVILDEPTIGLDPSQVVDIRALIREVGEKRTVIISSHILSEVQLMCSRVMLLHDGKIIADDTPDNLRKSMSEPNKVIAHIEGEIAAVEKALADRKVFEKVIVLNQKEKGTYEYMIEGKKNSDIRRQLFSCLAKADLPALAINSSQFTLEDYFLKHVVSSSGVDEEAHDVAHT